MVRRLLLRVALAVAVVAGCLFPGAAAQAYPTACFPADSSVVARAALTAAATLPEPSRSNMTTRVTAIGDDYASRGMFDSGGYIDAVLKAGNQWGFEWDCSTNSRFYDLDRTAPTVGVTVSSGWYSMSGVLRASWSGSDVGRGLRYVDARWQRAPFNGTFSAWSYPAGWQHLTGHALSLSMAPGFTYCVSVRGVDWPGNVSAWSVPRCGSAPLDDRSLAASSGWRRTTGAAFYDRTVTQTARQYQVLSRSRVQARRVAVLATRCSGCGTVGVYWNGRLVRKLVLDSVTYEPRSAFTVLSSGNLQVGTLSLKTLTARRTVQIDGLALSRQ